MKNQSGFTLIEMVVVIVVLGILSAIAVPKFIAIQVDARISTVDGLNGAMQSASALAHAQGLIAGVVDGTISMEGVNNVTLVNGYPASASGGIDAAVSIDGFTYTAGTGVFSLDGAPAPATCSVTYVEAAATTTPPTFTVNNGGC